MLEDHLKISETVKLFRVLSCLTQDDLALISGANQKYIANIESNKFKASPVISEKVAVSLQLAPHFLAGYSILPVFRSPIVYYSLSGEHMANKTVNDTNKSLWELLPKFIAQYSIKEYFHSSVLSTYNFIVYSPNTRSHVSDWPISLMIIHTPLAAFSRTLYKILAEFPIQQIPLSFTNDLTNIPETDDRAIAAFFEPLKKKYHDFPLKELRKVYEKERFSRHNTIQKAIIDGISDNVFKTLSRFNLPCEKLLTVLSARCAQAKSTWKEA